MSLVEIALSAWIATATQSRLFVTEPPGPWGPGVLVCRIASEASVGRRVRVEALDRVGTATLDSGSFLLAPGATYLSSGGVDARRCRFSLDGEAGGLVAYGLVVSADGEIPIPPARVR